MLNIKTIPLTKLKQSKHHTTGTPHHYAGDLTRHDNRLINISFVGLTYALSNILSQQNNLNTLAMIRK
jgi:hypothetical protein